MIHVLYLVSLYLLHFEGLKLNGIGKVTLVLLINYLVDNFLSEIKRKSGEELLFFVEHFKILMLFPKGRTRLLL